MSTRDYIKLRPGHFSTIPIPSARFIKMRHKSNVSEVFPSPGVFTQPRDLLGPFKPSVELNKDWSIPVLSGNICDHLSLCNHLN